MKFEKYNLSEDLLQNLLSMGFHRTTDIQYKAIPSILNGEDLLAIAQTGTGKTAAFAIPIVDRINKFKTSKASYGIKCLVLVPTRELAGQIGKVFNQITKHTKVKAFALYGGVEQDQQIERLQDGIDILISTPGRMFDLINQKSINLQNISTLVLDEADHMLDLGFIEDIENVKRLIKSKHQTLFFSATINKEIKKLAFSQVKGNAIRIQLSPKDPVSKNVSHHKCFIEMDDKRHFLESFIKNNPEAKIIIFVRTKVRAERVQKAMARVDISILALHGDMEQKERMSTLDDFRANKNRIMVATDVSARGIDIPDITHVINYDLPDKPENYVHRVGRTGRGFNKGEAISFVAGEEMEKLKAIEEILPEKINKIKIKEADYQDIANPFDLEEDIASMLQREEDLLFKKSKKKKK